MASNPEAFRQQIDRLLDRAEESLDDSQLDWLGVAIRHQRTTREPVRESFRRGLRTELVGHAESIAGQLESAEAELTPDEAAALEELVRQRLTRF
jgi:hypothetical protein